MRTLAACSALAAAALLAACGQPAANEGADGNATETTADRAEQSGSEGNADRSLAYPGSRTTGDGFSTSDPVDRVLAWYNDPARRGERMFVSSERMDDFHILIGTSGDELKPFALKLVSRSDGGTDARLIPYDPKVGLDVDLVRRS